MVRALHGIDHGRKARRLHADDLDARLERLGRRGHARHQAAAANGHHQRVQVGHGRSISSASVPWPAATASSS